MKKKLLMVLPILIFAIIFFIQSKSYATTYENEYFNYYIPNKYQLSESNVTETSISKTYKGQDGTYQTEISFSAYKKSNVKQFTQEDIDGRIEYLYDEWEFDDDYELKTVEGSFVEINGVKGIRILHSKKFYDTGLEYVNDYYCLASDNFKWYIDINSSWSVVNSSEAQKIINSFIMKDTVLKSKGIPFTDVSSDAWYYNAVKYTYQNNIMSGLDKYTFGPNEKLTRGMIVTTLWKMEGCPANDGKSKFTDVASSAWYAQAVKWAANNKIVSGYSGTTNFGPKDNVTRQDLAVILRNYASYKGKNINSTADLSSFTDAGKISNYAKPAMQWAVAKGVITGNAKTKTLNPKGNATRAETAAMIVKYCDNVGK